MSNSGRKSKRLPPLSIRLTSTERDTLASKSGGLPVSTYIKHVVFADGGTAVRRSPRAASADRELLGRVLAALGASRIASNLSQIAKHANLGNLYFDEACKADIRDASAHIREIRGLLMAALGKAPHESRSHQLLSRIFNEQKSPSDGAAGDSFVQPLADRTGGQS